jgi:hypothetical protein
MQKKTAGLNEVWKLYLFTRGLPGIVSILSELLESCNKSTDASGDDDDVNFSQSSISGEKLSTITKTIREKFITPLDTLVSQFSLYQQLIEHVIDLDKLPNLVIDPQHDPELQELRAEQIDLEAQGERLCKNARNTWANFASIMLEVSSQYGLIFRSTNGDDERQLRANNSSVRVLSIKKVQIHCTRYKYFIIFFLLILRYILSQDFSFKVLFILFY